VTRALGAALLIASASASWAASGHQSGRILSIDAWWTLDYARNIYDAAASSLQTDRALIKQVGCDAVSSCPERTAIATACRANPRAEVLRFFDRLKARIASNAQCLAVRNLTGPIHR
jgi:hypothetical protein